MPCQNSGHCQDDLTSPLGFICQCEPPYSGSLCEVAVNSCTPSPCLNNGKCSLDELGAFCTCPDKFNGLFCQHLVSIPAESCLDNGRQCKNGGRCERKQNDAIFSCVCVDGYTGKMCEKAPSLSCNPSPCNIGDCIKDLFDAPVCVCPPGFSLPFCT